MVPLSILDLVPVILGETPREALRKSLDLVQHAEKFGYKRYWVAEHHNMTAVRRGLEDFVALTKADELMIVTSIYDHAARVRSYELVAERAE